MQDNMFVVVDKKGAKLSALEMKYNWELDNVSRKIAFYLRQEEIKDDCEMAISVLEDKIKEYSEFLEYLEDMDEHNMIGFATAKINYETYDGSIKDITTEADRYKRMEDHLKNVLDGRMATAEVRRDKNKAINDKENYKNLRLNAMKVMEEIREELPGLIKSLKKTATYIETIVGYSIGSNMLDWCYNDAGDLVMMPQVSHIRVVEKYDVKGVIIDRKPTKETEEVSVESEI